MSAEHTQGSALHSPRSIKTVGEALSYAECAVLNFYPEGEQRDRYAAVIAELLRDVGRQRPTGPDGKHGDRHTDTCGCDDTAHRPVCETFAWIGQALTHCDDCGKPFWEHTHEYAGDSPFGDGRRPITDEKRAAVRRKWEGYGS